MFSFESEVRYSELNFEGKLSLDKILDYFQDCSSLHSESLNVGLEFLNEQQRAWVLSSWQVEIKKYPLYKEKITISTWPYGFKSFFGYRNFMMHDKYGEVMAQANSAWILLDLNTMRPTKVLPEMVSAYQLEPALPMSIESGKIIVSEQMRPLPPFETRKYHIDINQHVNNAKYILFAEECMPNGFNIIHMRAEYRRAAVYGDIIYPYIAEHESKVTVLLADQEKKPYAVIELEKS